MVIDALVCGLRIGEVEDQQAVSLGMCFVADVSGELHVLQCQWVHDDVGIGTKEGSNVITM